MVELHTISVGLTYNIGKYEFKKSEVTVKVEPTDSRERARNFAADECALILAAGNPEVYKHCIQKLSGEVNLKTIEKLRMERIEALLKFETLKDRLIGCHQWLKTLEVFAGNEQKWLELINNRTFWDKLNTAFWEFTEPNSSPENSEENQADDIPFPDEIPVE